jgi:hypothetical protein
VANRAIVPVGTGGTISIYNDSGMTRPVIDVSGYFTDGAAHLTGGYYVPVTSSRVVDTRYWQTTSYLSTRTLKTQKIAGQRCVLSPARTLCGRVLVPPVTAAQRPIAALLNITAVPRGGSGYLTAFPAGSPIPSSSDVSFTSSTVASNIAFVGLGSLGEVSVQNSGGPADVVEDVIGYFVLPAVALPPARVTKAVALKIPGSGSRWQMGRGGGTVAAPAFFATTGHALPASSRTSVGGTGAPSAQLTRPSPISSSAAVTQRSLVPLARTAPVTSLSPTTPLQAAPSITRPSQAAPPVTRLSQAAPPVTRLSQAAPSVTRISQTAAPATSFSRASAQAHCLRHAGHHDDESHPVSGR